MDSFHATRIADDPFHPHALPQGFRSASLGELLKQGQNNLQAPWVGICGFMVISLMLSLLIFIGEALREAFDPRKV